ncbi:unannotated protein [freshwater metagenome]|uniref:Unannotated protein n=1 Tax=freshwater metagenome TaxID=449393 RepID=A0A6J6GF82_9ZZZZ
MEEGVNALLTRRRNRVWSGGSRFKMVFDEFRLRRRSRLARDSGSVGSFALASMSRLKSLLRNVYATSS